MNRQKHRWKPSVTVAALVERDGRFLVAEEETADGLRFNQPAGHLDEGRPLDDGIVAAHWLTLAELRATRERHRSPLVLQCVEDWLAGRRFPLDAIRHYD